MSSFLFVPQWIRFSVVGVLATTVHVAMAVALIELGGWRPVPGNGAAFMAALLASYVANYYWTYRSNRPHAGALPRFAVVALSGFALNSLLMHSVVTQFHLNYRFGLALVVLVVPVLSYVANKRWAFG